MTFNGKAFNLREWPLSGPVTYFLFALMFIMTLGTFIRIESLTKVTKLAIIEAREELDDAERAQFIMESLITELLYEDMLNDTTLWVNHWERVARYDSQASDNPDVRVEMLSDTTWRIVPFDEE